LGPPRRLQQSVTELGKVIQKVGATEHRDATKNEPTHGTASTSAPRFGSFYRRSGTKVPPPPRCSRRDRPAAPRLPQARLDDVREVVASPVQSALHRAEIATGDLRDLLVSLPLHLPQHEN